MRKVSLDKDELKKYCDEGLSQRELATKFKCSRTAIKNSLKENSLATIPSISLSELLLNVNLPNKKCSICKAVKSKETDFSYKPSSKDGYFSSCKECEKHLKKNHRQKRKQKVLSESEIKKEKLVRLFDSTKARAKKRNLPFSISFEWLVSRCDNQNDCCLLTGLKLNFQRDSNGISIPFSPSLDQIKPGQGYTENNTRLVCTAINLGMNKFGEQVFKTIAESYLENVKTA